VSDGATPPETTWKGWKLPFGVRLFDGLLRLKERLGLPAPPITAERMIEKAQRRTGLDDLGPGDITEPFSVLGESLEKEANLSSFGHLMLRAMLLRSLERRLRAVDFLKRNPEVREQKIDSPLFIVGFPRTGTTLLLNLLAQDPRARPLLGWEAYHTTPPPGLRPGRKDPRPKRHRKSLRGIDRVLPEIQTVHPITADGPEECLPLLLRSFATWAWCLYAHLPSYESWVWEQPLDVHEETYRFHKLQLQILLSQRGGERWLLKSPAHLNGLQALVNVYPDACVIQTHRDLSEVLPSGCSLFGVLQSLFTKSLDPKALGRRGLEMGVRTLDRLVETRSGVPVGRILDVRYADLVADPIAAVERVYDYFGLELADEVRAGMERWMVEHPRHKHGVHRYTLEQFGLSKEEVERAAAPYHDRFLSSSSSS
jgi:hypothetical protein